MRVSRFRLAALALTSAVALSGCAYGLYDDGYGYGGYGPYGYGPYGGSSVSIGIGYGSGYGSYGYGGYGYPYGGYYGGYDPFGWYGDYYYPGTGIYVYDRARRPRVWNDDQRRYWQERHSRWQSNRASGAVTGSSGNWSGWDRSRAGNWRDGGSSRARGDWNRMTSGQTSTAPRSEPRRSDGQQRSRPSRETAAERPD